MSCTRSRGCLGHCSTDSSPRPALRRACPHCIGMLLVVCSNQTAG
jgi:hypothetical protein